MDIAASGLVHNERVNMPVITEQVA
ncbi:hypothetical protein [Citrobacter amalonaticus]|nr:hypothetical protein [Citrobacter amalonaticus]